MSTVKAGARADEFEAAFLALEVTGVLLSVGFNSVAFTVKRV